MKPLGSLKRHFWLVKRMAKTTGVDLVTARETGALSQKDWAKMVSRCRTCACPGACNKWLDLAALSGGADAQPSYCENKERLRSLKTDPITCSVQD